MQQRSFLLLVLSRKPTHYSDKCDSILARQPIIQPARFSSASPSPLYAASSRFRFANLLTHWRPTFYKANDHQRTGPTTLVGFCLIRRKWNDAGLTLRATPATLQLTMANLTNLIVHLFSFVRSLAGAIDLLANYLF